MAKFKVGFTTLGSGPFKIEREESFDDMKSVRGAVEAHAKSAGYTNVKEADDDESIRFTARTPGAAAYG